ncbi:Endonuclease/exonuclease/phosphatase [Corchorus olitorius]|uniref:Endonuclease/exonuclease/phosphatase n=1 Tax=Corchorus olitorius TaxID=93759 RepID=A0A1R3HX68_9ROSI|nr:Endonuclease/exonuclease/phosphatase [Corchorus olitorius]
METEPGGSEEENLQNQNSQQDEEMIPLHNNTREFPPFEFPPLEPIIDPVVEFDSSVARIEQLEERRVRDSQNLADLEDMQYSLNREHVRLEVTKDTGKAESSHMGSQRMRGTPSPESSEEGRRGSPKRKREGEENAHAQEDQNESPGSMRRKIREEAQPEASKEADGLRSPQPMSLLSWNVRGLGQPLTISYGSDLVQRNKTQICFLMETKTSVLKASRLTRRWGFSNWLGTDARGLSGGTLLLWRDNVAVDILFMNKNLLSAYITVNGKSFWLTCIYGSPHFSGRKKLWMELMAFRSTLPQRQMTRSLRPVHL